MLCMYLKIKTSVTTKLLILQLSRDYKYCSDDGFHLFSLNVFLMLKFRCNVLMRLMGIGLQTTNPLIARSNS